MMINYSNQKLCKYGDKCSFGINCKFYHPQKLQNFSTPEIESLNQQFGQLELIQHQVSYNSKPNQPKLSDAQFQQFYQQNTFNNFWQNTSCDFSSEFHAMAKQEQQSSDSRSSDDREEKKQKHESRKKQKKHQKQSLQAQDKIKKSNKKQWNQQHRRKHANPQSYQLYAYLLFPFFEKRRISPKQRFAILKFLSKQLAYQPYTAVNAIIPMIQQLQKEGFIAHFCYKKFFKTIVNQNFQMEAVKEKLNKKLNIQKKKESKDQLFQSKFENPVDVQFLQTKDLLENHEKDPQTIYLIDGNNCLPTQKHLRFFFQQKSQKAKAQAQIRFRWLISLLPTKAQQCFIFFDNEFSQDTYKDIMNRLMSAEEQKRILKNTTLVYAKQGQEADDKIREKLKQLKGNRSQKQLRNIIIVTGDRILIQQCYSINHLRRTSGLYLIKFLKNSLKKQAKIYPEVKQLLKKIFNYEDDSS